MVFADGAPFAHPVVSCLLLATLVSCYKFSHFRVTPLAGGGTSMSVHACALFLRGKSKSGTFRAIPRVRLYNFRGLSSINIIF